MVKKQNPSGRTFFTPTCIFTNLCYICFMKWLIMIFALYILALSASPCCDKDCCDDGTTQSSSKAPNKQEAPCSPFFTCNTCHGFIIPETTIALTKPAVTPSIKCSFVINDDLSDFVAVAWQPPQQS